MEAKLGRPNTSRPLPDGSRLDTYAYTIRNPEWQKWKWEVAALSIGTVFLGEALFTPMAARELTKHRRTATVAYDSEGLVLRHGPPPSYGPPDDALDTPSFDAIRERCRAEHGGELPSAPRAPQHRLPYAYEQCVARRVAIWGIE